MRDTSADKPTDCPLRRELGPFSLIAFGVSSTIGSGIFVITGLAAARYAGPAVSLSYCIAGVACLCAGLCYAELAAQNEEAGSAYSYARTSMGETLGWIIGWDLILEFLFSAASGAVGWSGFLSGALADLGIALPQAVSGAPVALTSFDKLRLTGHWLNLPAVALVSVQTTLLFLGIRESRAFIGSVIALYVLVILVTIVCGSFFIETQNWRPFIPSAVDNRGHFGWRGMMTGAAIVFFSYTGFEAISASTREARDPKKDLPIALLGSLAICAILYVSMALVMTGLTRYDRLGGAEPIIDALRAPGDHLTWLIPFVRAGIIIGLSAASMGSMYAQIRIFYSMARDHLLPPMFKSVHPRHQTPQWSTLVVGLSCALIAGLLPLEILGELVSIGTLLAFAIVCVSVLLLRLRSPHATRPFTVPAAWIVAPLGVAICLYMTFSLPADTWWRLLIWMFAGALIYLGYGRRRAARLKEAEVSAPWRASRTFRL